MSPYRIVVVDDAPELRALVRSRLRLDGRFEVVDEGGTGHDALRAATDRQPDLMLLDVSMPGLGGLEVLAAIRERSPGTRVVLFSGFREGALVTRARELGAAAYVQKTTDLDDLVQVLHEVAGGHEVRPDGAGAGADGLLRTLEPVLGEHVERFREVFDRAAIGVATLTLTGQIVRANPALGALLGADPTDLVGVTLADLVPAAEQHIVAFTVARALDSGVAHLEHHLRDADRTVHTTVAVVRDSRGRPLYLLLQSQDVSAQRHAERALLESEERFRLLVDSVTDYAIFMLDAHGRIASWNRGAERMKGWTSDEVLGRHFRTFYEPEAQAARHPEHELELAARDGRYDEEGWRVRKDGTRFWAHVVLTALRDPDGALVGYAKVTRDVTQQREASLRLETTAEELAEVNTRLGEAAQERANLLAITAHELRSPLAVVAGTSQTLRRHWADLTPQERDDMLRSAEASTDRMRRMLDGVLLAARLEAGRVEVRPAAVRLAPLLEAVVASHTRLLTDVEVTVDCPPDLVVTTDADQLTQIVTNYVGNATRHGTGPVRVRGWRVPDTVTVVVEDHGPGLPSAVAGQAFHEMFLSGGSRRSTGLGLYIVRRLAVALGGEAWYERADGVTRFGVSLPAEP